MNPYEQYLAANALDGATKTGVLTAAASIASGAAISSANVQVLGFITIGTVTSVSWPLVVAAGAAGAVAGGATAMLRARRRQQRVEEQFQALLDD